MPRPSLCCSISHFPIDRLSFAFAARSALLVVVGKDHAVRHQLPPCPHPHPRVFRHRCRLPRRSRSLMRRGKLRNLRCVPLDCSFRSWKCPALHAVLKATTMPKLNFRRLKTRSLAPQNLPIAIEKRTTAMHASKTHAGEPIRWKGGLNSQSSNGGWPVRSSKRAGQCDTVLLQARIKGNERRPDQRQALAAGGCGEKISVGSARAGDFVQHRMSCERDFGECWMGMTPRMWRTCRR